MKTLQSKLGTALIPVFMTWGIVGISIGDLKAQTFTQQTLTGDYIISERGLLGTATALAGIGRLTFDGQGGISGWESVQVNSTNFTSPVTGRYTVDADGSGVFSLTHPVASSPSTGDEGTATANYRFLAMGSGGAATEIKALRSDNGLAVSASLTRAQSGSSLGTLQGSYIFTEEGTLGAGTGIAALGLITFDGNGTVSGSELVQTNGTNLTTIFTGTYSMASDGTGTLQLIHPTTAVTNDNAAGTGIANYKFVVVDNGAGVSGRNLRALRSDNGRAVSATFSTR